MTEQKLKKQNSQTEESYPCIKCGKLRPEIVSRLKNVSNQKFITESQMLEKLNQLDTEEYKEALYYAQLGSATKGKTVIDELVKAIRADEREKIGELVQAMPDKQSLREWMATEILTDATLLSAIQIADSILSHIREEIEKVESGLTDEEILGLVTNYQFSGIQNRHSLIKSAVKVQESNTKQAILKLLEV
jgi:hypothetical protein